jgi:hypothetical protein
MRARLERGLDLHSLGTRGLRAIVRELWQEQRAAQEAARDGFVADRSSLDYAAFWLHYDLHEDPDGTDVHLEEMRASADDYDRILLFPWGALPLEHDGVRTTNRWVQLRFQTILEGLLERWAPSGLVARVPAHDDFDARLAEVLAALGEPV